MLKFSLAGTPEKESDVSKPRPSRPPAGDEYTDESDDAKKLAVGHFYAVSKLLDPNYGV